MLTIDRAYCTGCKLCEKNCPTGAIKVTRGKAKINHSICNNCYHCVYVCSNSAIKQKIQFIGKGGVSNIEELKELSIVLDSLRNELKGIKAGLNKIERKRINFFSSFY